MDIPTIIKLKTKFKEYSVLVSIGYLTSLKMIIFEGEINERTTDANVPVIDNFFSIPFSDTINKNSERKNKIKTFVPYWVLWAKIAMFSELFIKSKSLSKSANLSSTL
ncbi:hypothetical protein SDC9_212373 [bioreactor metagenome]|uniref:Uncharacterized protein n=1 Tax=bioreactor metagenome TaxID=1076179 RepID=A0A645JMM5_9ZZZZ